MFLGSYSYRGVCVYVFIAQCLNFNFSTRRQCVWLLIIYAQNPYYLKAASILAGIFGTGHNMCMSIFVIEIAHDK